MEVTVLAANPEVWRWRKKEMAKLIDISFGFVDLMKEESFLNAASYWRRVESDLSASVKSMFSGSMPKRRLAANFRKPIKSSCWLARMKLTQSWFGLLVTAPPTGITGGGAVAPTGEDTSCSWANWEPLELSGL